MKTTRNKNKHLKKFLSIPIIVSLIFVTQTKPVLTRADTTNSTSVSSTDIQNAEKAAKQAQLVQLNQQIASYQTQIKQQESLKASLKNEISLYDLQIKSTTAQIQATQLNIDNTNVQIQAVQAQIATKTDQIAQEKVSLAALINALSQMDATSTLQLGLSSNNFSDFLDQVQYTQTIQGKTYDLLEQIKALKEKLQQDEDNLQTNLTQLKNLQSQQTQTQASLTEQKSGKVALLNQTNGSESKYQKLLTQSQSEYSKINDEINNLDKKVSGSKGFKSLPVIHGILAWPIDGVITQGYGNTGFTALGYNFHNGIDIAAPAGTPISAAADGVVMATGTGKTAYGNWVAIKHTITSQDGHAIITLYGHMRSFIVSSGQTVKQGDLIGYEGNTGNTTRLLYGPDHGYHLHLSVFDADGFGIAPGAYQNIYGAYQVPYGYTYDPMSFL